MWDPAGWFRRPGWLAVAVGLATLLVHLPALRGDFVNYDDPDYVTSNRMVQGGLTWAGVKWAFTTGQASNWHPLTWLSHLLDVTVFGLRPWGHHLTSVLLHALNAGLLFVGLRRLTGEVGASLFVAAVFGLHPLRVESVAWVSERKDVLSGLFALLTLLAWVGYAGRRGARTGVGEPGFGEQRAKVEAQDRPAAATGYGLALGCFALGLLSKPMLVTLPFVLLLLDGWPLHRWPATPAWRLVVEKLPFFLLAATSSVVTFLVQREGGAVSPLAGLPVGARLGNAVIAYWRYLGALVWPADLSVMYPHPGFWPAPAVTLAAAGLAAATGWLLWQSRRRPWLGVGWLWFLGMMVPVIGLVQVGIQSMADRYTYLPLIGPTLMLAWLGREWMAGEARNWARQWLPLAGGAAVVALGILTLNQIAFWKDSEALFRRAVAVTRNNYLAHNNLGFHLSAKGRTEEALAEYQKSLAINPNYEEARNNLGYALAKLGRPAEAIPHYEAALRTRPNLAEAHNNLGNALSDLGRLDEAIARYEKALALKPDHADAHNNLAIALAMKGRFDQAIPHFEQSLRLKPNNASAHSNLGNAYALQRQFDLAVEHYRKALALAPGEAQAHNNLGNVLAEQGRLAEAEASYRQALRLNPQNPEACFNLGMSLLRQDQREAAARSFREALRLKPDYPEARRQLDALGR